MECSFDLKKSRNDWRKARLVIKLLIAGIGPRWSGDYRKTAGLRQRKFLQGVGGNPPLAYCFFLNKSVTPFDGGVYLVGSLAEVFKLAGDLAGNIARRLHRRILRAGEQVV